MNSPHPAAAPAGIPPGWYLECPMCTWTGGQHAPHCRGAAIPRLAGLLAVASPPVPGPPPPPARIPLVTPVPGERLDQLLGMRKTAQAAADEAAARLAAIEAGIKAEVAAAHPGCSVVDIAGSPLRTALRLRWRDGDLYVPAEALRNKYQDVWDELAIRKRGGWRLHELGDGS